MSEEDRINKDLVPQALTTMEILMNESDDKTRFLAAKEILLGTVFKKNVNNNSIILNLNQQRDAAKEIVGEYKKISTKSKEGAEG